MLLSLDYTNILEFDISVVVQTRLRQWKVTNVYMKWAIYIVYCTIFVNRVKVLGCEVADLMVNSVAGLAWKLKDLNVEQK